MPSQQNVCTSVNPYLKNIALQVPIHSAHFRIFASKGHIPVSYATSPPLPAAMSILFILQIKAEEEGVKQQED